MGLVNGSCCFPTFLIFHMPDLLANKNQTFLCMTFLPKTITFTVNISTTYRFCELKHGLWFSKRVKCRKNPPFTTDLLPKVAKSIKKKSVRFQFPSIKMEKKDMKTCAWRYITFSVAYVYFVSCFVLTL